MSSLSQDRLPSEGTGSPAWLTFPDTANRELAFLRAENHQLSGLLRRHKEESHKRIEQLESLMRELSEARDLDRRSAWILEMVSNHAPLPRTLQAIAALARSCGNATGAAFWTANGNVLSMQASENWPEFPDAEAAKISLDEEGDIAELSCARFENRVREAAVARGVDARFILLRDSEGKVIGLLVAFGPNDYTWGTSAGVLVQLANLASLAIESGNLYDRLAFHAQHDVLTGLPNRMLFHESVERAIARAEKNDEKVAVLWIDLDRFKQINDTFGHKAGDELLFEVARGLRRSVHSNDTVARLGGDEFIVVISNATSEAVAESIAERILQTIRNPLTLNGHEVRVSASIGISLYPDQGRDAALLMRNADLAMYHAKRTGRNQCQTFLPEFGSSVQRQPAAM